MMYIPERPFNEADYIITSSGTMVSRSAVLHNPNAVVLAEGKCIIHEKVVIHGDLAPVKINRYSIIGGNSGLLVFFL